MIQRRIQYREKSATHKVVAAMLVVWLNLALLPCAMAFEIAEPAHDCCPPTIELQQIDCCALDDVTHDYRDTVEPDKAIAGPTESRCALPSVRTVIRQAPRPVDPDGSSPPIHVLNCVYLK